MNVLQKAKEKEKIPDQRLEENKKKKKFPIKDRKKAKDRNIRQISPSGVVLETISPDGVVSKLFPTWDSYLRENHACRTQTARTSGEFGVLEQIASTNGDTCMQRQNRQSKWRYGLRFGNRQSNWRVPWPEAAGLRPCHGSVVQMQVQAKPLLPLAVCLA